MRWFWLGALAALCVFVVVAVASRSLGAMDDRAMSCLAKGGEPIFIHGQLVCFSSQAVLK